MATDEEGPVTVPVTIVQETSTKLPVRLRLEPSQVSAIDTPYVDLDIVVDNRGGHEDAVVSLKGGTPPTRSRSASTTTGSPWRQDGQCGSGCTSGLLRRREARR